MIHEQIQYVPIEKIRRGSSLRQAAEEPIGLARSIQETGKLLQPVRLRRVNSELTVIDGFRRLRAAELIKLGEIPAIIEERELSDGEVLHQQLIGNVQRSELTPSERARGLRQLIQVTGWQVAEAAAKCGLSNGTVTKLLTILQKLPESILAQVDAGQIPLTAGYQLARIADPAKQAELAQRFVEGTLTRDTLVASLKSDKKAQGKKKRSKAKRITVPLARGESVTVASPQLSLERVIEVVGELLNKAREAHARGIELKTFVRTVRHEAKSGLVQA